MPDVQVHALVGRAQWTLADGTTRFGQCSDYITHLAPGDKVRFKIARVSKLAGHACMP